MDALQHIHPATRAEWRSWLAAHQTQNESVWFVYGKVGCDAPRVAPDEAIEEALCFGWIDSLPRRLDDTRSRLLFSPRKPGSNWSALNKRRAEAMIGAGRMMPAGQAKIDAAKADGSWSALDAVEALVIPADLKAAFARHPGGADAFAAFPKSARRGILEWILNAKRDATRARRIEETARLAAQGERANQWRRR